ncbi:MAG: UvrD-helicase domain-containing protein, partial [Bacteroidota bacterium]
LNLKEIQQVWKAVKELTEKRSSVSFSALEIARKAGWDENIREIETRITTAIAALENSEYLKRGQNSPIVYANSILSKNAQEAIDKINNSHKFNEKQKITATRIIKKLIASKSRKESVDEVAESRVDYISDHLGIATSEVMKIVNLLKEEKILADTKDLAAFIKKGENVNRSLNIVTTFCHLENFLLPIFGEIEKVYHLKEINELAEEKNLDVNPNKIKTIINFWAIKNWIKRYNETSSKNHVKIVRVQPHVILADTLKKRHELAKFIVEYLYRKSLLQQGHKEEILVDFSIHEIKEAYEKSPSLFKANIILDDIEETLFFLSRIEAIKIEGGFLVIHNKLRINRLEQDNNKRYKIKDYEKLNQFYENKIQQIHIVGEYAKKMLQDYNAALQFVEDYFQLNYTSFLNKYFPGSRQNEIKQNITPAKFKELFGTLSPSQLAIIKDSKSNYIAVAAGPGSGKTRILVHKLASLLLMEDVKHEQLLMLTFSRAAATEFKKRLLSLIGNAANFVEIKTFHSYCFDLLGKVGSIEKSDEIIKTTIQKIKNREVEQNRVSKSVLVIDEAQDINEEEYKLIETLMEINEEMRVIVVGDDDQNIYEFRGSSSKYFEMFITGRKAVKYELIDNYRSKKNLVEFTNTFVKRINHRIKTTPINAIQRDNGELKIIHYLSGNLISPLVKNVLSTGLSGTTCILTKTNDEALKITGLLIKNGQPAKLVQANDGFNLFNLAEVRYFIDQLNLFEDTYVFDDELWNQAKSNLVNKYQNSTKLDICINLIKDFEITNPKKKYKSDLEVFFRESKLEDCYNGENDTIIVSTMHKSKGKEYDNIFILLENFNCLTDPAKRQLYVAMTRAKKNLAIHVNDNYLNNISADDLEYVSIDGNFNPPHQVVMHLTFKDVWLDYFIHKQHFISKLNCGDTLQFNGGECFDSQGNSVLKFSKNFMHTIESFKEGYELKEVKINFIIHWKKEELEEEVKIILPELYFSKG